MVNSLVLTGILLQGIIPIIAVVCTFLYFYKKDRFSWKPVWIGVLTFFIFTQILEKIMHVAVLGTNPDVNKHAILLIIYGPLAAGVFEETGRYLAMRFILKRHRDRKDGIAFGIGHGGFEALFIGVITSIQSFMYALLLNQGKLDSMLSGKLSAEAIASLKASILQVPFSHLLVGGLERIPAIPIQIALSLFVLIGIRKGNKMILPAAIFLHAAFDFFPTLYQVHFVNLWTAECLIAIVGCLAALYIVKSRKAYAS
ncbi:YhfC family intramembrane metalloprotease [Paenibacillus sp. GCM10027628]|uniref:YhfC family intramembrane metalloprotease n=1 Tax=Paenibacillus sp. GCM10027628 TaxID=3273413 RepID=UPI0036287B2B